MNREQIRDLIVENIGPSVSYKEAGWAADAIVEAFEAAQVLSDDAREALIAVWDDGNAVGLDGWVGPGRGTEPVDDYAIYARDRAIEKYGSIFRHRPATALPSSSQADLQAYVVP